MPHAPLHIAVDDPVIVDGLARIRDEQHVPGPHPIGVVAEAEGAAVRVLAGLDDSGRHDARDIDFVTIDPPGSRDLDQALHIERRNGGAGGWRVRYAIADLAAFVGPGGALDQSCWDRGLTYYLPDGGAPLHPEVLGVGAASLLPKQDRPAVLWTIDLDADGGVTSTSVVRAIVRSRDQLTYEQVQRDVDRGTAAETLVLLSEVGEVRRRQEAARGGVSLDLPAQRVEADDGGYRIEFETTVPAMAWNAQISLLAGMVAAERMVTAGVGLLRTVPPPEGFVVDRVRHTARALHVAWPDGASYADVVRDLRSDVPDQAALLSLASRGLRGAGYIALPVDGDGVELAHAAVAAQYAHVTAPLRRLGDRYVAETCLAIEAGDRPPAWVTERLPALPETLGRASSRESAAARAAVDLVEALVLRPMVGDTLDVTVVAADKEGSTVVCRDPAIQARVHQRLELGDHVTVRITAADPTTRTVNLEPTG
ncbi:MAG TPA: RNB domain-containing ribonuclease [Acidimicrobiales bacterium]